MTTTLEHNDMRESLERRGYSRRDFMRVTTLLTAGATLAFHNEASLAQLSSLGPGGLPEGAVKINANENPLGPTDMGLTALMAAAKNGGRYQYPETDALVATAAKLERLSPDSVAAYPGSSLALHHAVIAYTSPTRPLITVDPGYEAAARAAAFIGASVVRVPLELKTGRQDVKAMVAAAKDGNAGLIYLCSPNNPTGTVVPASDVKYVIDNAPRGTTVLLDEAYIHYTNEPTGTPYIASGKDVIVIKTFSKLYGMAGLRAGLAFGRPELLNQMTAFKAGAMPATAMACAEAMLREEGLVDELRDIMADLRADLMSFFDTHGFDYAPSESGKVMVDTGRPVHQVISAMASRNVYIGRPWPAWPTYSRISIGTADEMETFKNAFLQVLAT